MDRIEKFLRLLDARTRKRVEEALVKILAGEEKDLDCKPLQGYDRLWRFRVGGVRIIFQKRKDGRPLLLDIGFRGGIYKKRR